MTAERKRVEDAGLARRGTGTVALRRIGVAARDVPTRTRPRARDGAAPRARRAGAGAHPVVELAAHAGRLDRRGRRATRFRRRGCGRGGGRGARRCARQALEDERVTVATRVGALGGRGVHAQPQHPSLLVAADRNVDERSAGRALERARARAGEPGVYVQLLEMRRRMARRQVRILLVDADRDAERAGVVPAHAVGVTRVAVDAADDAATADV